MSGLSKSDVYEIFRQSKLANNKPPDLHLAIKTISERLVVEADSSLEYAVKNLLLGFMKYIQKQKSRSSSYRSNEDLSEVVLKSEAYTPLLCSDEPTPPPPKKRKSFCKLTKQTQCDRSDKILKTVNDWVDEENFDNENKISVTQFLGFLMYRINYMKDRKMSDLGYAIFENKVNDQRKFENLDAIAMMHDMTFTKSQMRNIKSYLGKKNVKFPNSTDLLEARKLLKPEIKIEMNGEGVSVDYNKLVEMTTASLITSIKHDVSIDNNVPITAIYKDGCDGSGSQSRWNSQSMIHASDHMFQYSIVPLRLEQGDQVLWKNPTPNAASCTRPVYLLRAGEDDQRVLDLVVSATDTARNMMSDCRFIEDSDGIEYKVTHRIHDTMKDLKLKKKWSGLGGADCIICDSKKKDWMDIKRIEEGFQITRTANSSMELFEKLIVDGDGEIVRKKNDYDTRKGLTTKPLTESDQHSITILHSYINVLGWFLKLMYRCYTSYECWIEKKTIIGEPIRIAKEKVTNILQETTGLTLDQVAGANDKTGTSNNGNQARRFFEAKNQNLIVSCVAGKYKETLSVLHKNISVILRVISSTSEVNCVKFAELTTATSLLIANKLPWVSINFTLHGLLHHSVELIELNGNWSLGSLSEEALESNNKFVRRYLEQFSRKISPVDQLKDAMTRLIERSDPKVIAHQRKFKNLRFCIVCNSSHHMTKNHNKYTHLLERSANNEYDSMVLDILLNEPASSVPYSIEE